MARVVEPVGKVAGVSRVARVGSAPPVARPLPVAHAFSLAQAAYAAEPDAPAADRDSAAPEAAESVSSKTADKTAENHDADFVPTAAPHVVDKSA